MLLFAFAGLQSISAIPAFEIHNPPRVAFLTHLGPTSAATDVAVDRLGYSYIAGITHSSQFLCTARAGERTPAPTPFSFLTKLKPDGGGVEWTQCISGNSNPRVALSNDAAVHVVLNLDRTVTVMSFRATDGSPIGTNRFSFVEARSVAVDRAGNIYVGGQAWQGFAATARAYWSQSNCTEEDEFCTDGFATKIAPDGAVVFSTLTNTGAVNDLAADSLGRVWVAGSTSWGRLGSRSFIAKLNELGTVRLFHESFGGGLFNHVASRTAATSLAVDNQDSAYLMGFTDYAFRATPGTLPGSINRQFDLPYLKKYDASGATIYASYLLQIGTPGSMLADDAGSVNVSSYFPAPFDGITCAPYSGRVSIINRDASAVVASVETDRIGAMALAATGEITIVGGAVGTPFATIPGAAMQAAQNDPSGFALRLDFSRPAGPRIRCVVNAASFQPGRNSRGPDWSVAQGELITIFGRALPFNSGLEVTFDGISAPVLYANGTQINAAVPFGAGKTGASVTVEIRGAGQVIGRDELPLAAASPGLFGVAEGQLAALNQDGTVNSPANPATRGDMVSVFLTGAGAYDTHVADGMPGPLEPPYPTPVLGIAASISQPSVSTNLLWPVEVLFAGQAPGLIAGVVQVNLRIPSTAYPGKIGVVIHVGDYATPRQQYFIEVR